MSWTNIMSVEDIKKLNEHGIEYWNMRVILVNYAQK